MVSPLTASGLQHEYPGGVTALRGVDLQLQPRELLVVIGPNGSGKSTLLRLLGGLLPVQQGEVAVDGQPLSALSPRDRAQLIGVVPQSLESLPEVTVESFVLGGRYTRISRWRGALARDLRAVGYALAASDAEGLGGRRLRELSGGQRQRVLVARALAQEAQILLVDEPTAALDLEHQVRVFDLLARLAAHDRSVLVVTHDVNLASQFASRVVLLDAGRVAASGAPAEVLRREVLEPVYGRHLFFGHMPPPDSRPFVLPWMSPGNGEEREPSPPSRGEA